jgi:LPXTG-site transpeptidase (sortase) family protein
MVPRLPLQWLQRGLLALGLLLLTLWSGTYLDARVFQSRGSSRLDAALRARESDPTRTALSTAAFVGPRALDLPKPAMEAGDVLGRIVIPRLGITAIVAEGADAKTLGRAVGHIPSTARPGRPGNCALAGHRDTFLRGLGRVQVGDLIRIVTLEGTYHYQVEWAEVVEPRRVDVLNATANPSLTLVTCYPFAFVGHAPQRFVVRARQVEVVADSMTMTHRAASRPSGLTAGGR